MKSEWISKRGNTCERLIFPPFSSIGNRINDCVIIDQLSCVQEQPLKGETKASLFGRITAGLKQIANQYNIPVILCAQINRQGTDEPLLHHLKDSGSIEEDSAVVLVLHSVNVDSPTQVICAKNRGGVVGYEDFNFKRSHMKFSQSWLSKLRMVRSSYP